MKDFLLLSRHSRVFKRGRLHDSDWSIHAPRFLFASVEDQTYEYEC